jgi:integrase
VRTRRLTCGNTPAAPLASTNAVNVAANMRGLPRRPELEMHFLDAVQVERIVEAIDPRYRLLVLVGAYTGLRPGEITGLKVKRLDLLRGKIEVAEARGPSAVGTARCWSPICGCMTSGTRPPRC